MMTGFHVGRQWWQTSDKNASDANTLLASLNTTYKMSCRQFVKYNGIKAPASPNSMSRVDMANNYNHSEWKWLFIWLNVI